MGVGYMYEGTIWYLGGIYFKLQLWWWLLVGQIAGFWKLQMEHVFDRHDNGMELWWRPTKIKDCWENY